MAHILKLLQFSQHHGVAQMNIRRCGVHAQIHAQRFASLHGLLELGLQFFFADDFRHALFQVRELLFHRLEFCGRHYFPSGPFRRINSTRRPSIRYRPSSTIRTASV